MELGTKETASRALDNYYSKFLKVPFQKPTYRRVEKIPFLPYEEEEEKEKEEKAMDGQIESDWQVWLHNFD